MLPKTNSSRLLLRARVLLSNCPQTQAAWVTRSFARVHASTSLSVSVKMAMHAAFVILIILIVFLTWTKGTACCFRARLGGKTFDWRFPFYERRQGSLV
mmetsp:Transcript_136653/g.340779  ORF Transcript_136653/g.340779 Transcript_136653/m.340779 type:complete len:99 (+) Transcript_136653:1037-1333(+)